MTFSYKHFTTDTGVACGEPRVSKNKQSHLHMRVTCPVCLYIMGNKTYEEILEYVIADIAALEVLGHRITELETLKQINDSILSTEDMQNLVGEQEIPCGPTDDNMFCACGCSGDDTRCDYWTRCYGLGLTTSDTHTCCKTYYTTAEVAEHLGLINPETLQTD